MFALRHLLDKHKDAVIHIIDKPLTVAAVGHIFHPGTRQFKGQHVTHHALVVVGSQQNPSAVLAHAQQRHLLPRAAVLERAVNGAEGVGFLEAPGIG